jgi:hypothetical protein
MAWSIRGEVKDIFLPRPEGEIFLYLPAPVRETRIGPCRGSCIFERGLDPKDIGGQQVTAELRDFVRAYSATVRNCEPKRSTGNNFGFCIFLFPVVDLLTDVGSAMAGTTSAYF